MDRFHRLLVTLGPYILLSISRFKCAGHVDRDVQTSKTHVVFVEIPFKSVHLRHGDGAGRSTLRYILRRRISGLACGQNWLSFMLNVNMNNFHLNVALKNLH